MGMTADLFMVRDDPFGGKRICDDPDNHPFFGPVGDGGQSEIEHFQKMKEGLEEYSCDREYWLSRQMEKVYRARGGTGNFRYHAVYLSADEMWHIIGMARKEIAAQCTQLGDMLKNYSMKLSDVAKEYARFNQKEGLSLSDLEEYASLVEGLCHPDVKGVVYVCYW